MAEWAALKGVSEGLGAAFTAYGKYEEYFGPALQTINWEECIKASERRIISSIKEVQFKTYTLRLAAVSGWWTGTCVDFLRNFPISPGNIQAFNAKIDIGQLRENILTINEILNYLGSDEAPGDYGTYGALLTAHSLHYILLTVAETYFIAVEGNSSGGKEISAAIVAVEIEEKYSGGGGPLGRAGEKRITGWYIVHDTANDPVVGTFDGQRFYRQFPKKEEMVSGRFDSSNLRETLIPAIYKEWGQLQAKATDAEPIEFPADHYWYHILNFLPPYLAISVINDSDTINSDPQLHLAPKADGSDHLWRVDPSELMPGLWNIHTLILGRKFCLDVYSNDKRRLHLAPAGNLSGQQWQVTDLKDGTWRLTNSYSGPNLLLEGEAVNADGPARLFLNEKQTGSVAQKWCFWANRAVTKEGGIGEVLK